MTKNKFLLGESANLPLPAQPPFHGRRYEGWTCKNASCERFVVFRDAVSNTPAADNRKPIWVRCAFCDAVNHYPMDHMSVEDYQLKVEDLNRRLATATASDSNLQKFDRSSSREAVQQIGAINVANQFVDDAARELQRGTPRP